jgi:hypothetical protein
MCYYATLYSYIDLLLGACPCVATGIQLSIRQHTKYTIKISQLKSSHPKNDLKMSAQFDMLIW